jgi:hypothetical protein
MQVTALSLVELLEATVADDSAKGAGAAEITRASGSAALAVHSIVQ